MCFLSHPKYCGFTMFYPRFSSILSKLFLVKHEVRFIQWKQKHDNKVDWKFIHESFEVLGDHTLAMVVVWFVSFLSHGHRWLGCFRLSPWLRNLPKASKSSEAKPWYPGGTQSQSWYSWMYIAQSYGTFMDFDPSHVRFFQIWRLANHRGTQIIHFP